MGNKFKRLSYYPREFYDFVRGVCVDFEQRIIRVESKQKAMSLRGQLYAFVGALKREAAAARIEQQLVLRGEQPAAAFTEEMQETIELDTAASQLMLVMKESSEPGFWYLEGQRREESWQAEALRSAVRKPAPSKGRHEEEERQLTEKILAQHQSEAIKAAQPLVDPNSAAYYYLHGKKPSKDLPPGD